MYKQLVTVIVIAMTGCASQSSDENSLEVCLDVLRETLHTQEKWVKVHAAEYLLWAGYPDGVKEVFLQEEKDHGTHKPYRIGIWRVLAQASDSAEEKELWISRIVSAFHDEDGTDRIHAAETLGKLHRSLVNYDPPVVSRALEGPDGRLRLYTRWSLMFTSADSISNGQRSFLNTCTDADAPEPEKELAAYVLGRIAHFSVEEWRSLAAAALSETDGSTTRLYMLTCALMTAPSQDGPSDLYMAVRSALVDYESSKEPGILAELSYALAKRGDGEDKMFLSRLLHEYKTGNRSGDSDVRAAAAFALLEIGKRQLSTLKN